jgi:hypothetical protein
MTEVRRAISELELETQRLIVGVRDTLDAGNVVKYRMTDGGRAEVASRAYRANYKLQISNSKLCTTETEEKQRTGTQLSALVSTASRSRRSVSCTTRFLETISATAISRRSPRKWSARACAIAFTSMTSPRSWPRRDWISGQPGNNARLEKIVNDDLGPFQKVGGATRA